MLYRDNKTAPRTVWLSSTAHAILGGAPCESPWVFPSPLTRRCLHPVTVGNISSCIKVEAELGMGTERQTAFRRLPSCQPEQRVRAERVAVVGILVTATASIAPP